MMRYHQKRSNAWADRTALEVAADLLARQEQSRERLRQKLERRGYGDDEISAALSYLEEKSYLNDEEACRRQLLFLYEESRQSLRQIQLKLQQRGFPRELIISLLEEVGEESKDENLYEREKTACLRALSVKYKRVESLDKQKLVAFLYRKGYDHTALRDAVETFLVERENEVLDDFDDVGNQ